MDITNTWLKTDIETVCRRIINRLMDMPYPTKDKFNRIKIDICREFNTPIPKNSKILKFLTIKEKKRLLQIIRTKPVRTISGVNVVAVMTAPADCPHGKCVYCPGGTKYDVPSSYTGYEPATMRGIQNRFDPYLQVKNRIDQLRAIGHAVNKVELIIMGGTFPATTTNYQQFFVKGCLDAITGTPSQNLKEAQRNAEKSKIRTVGLTFETRPDYCREIHIDMMFKLGVTRVELGVQNIYDDVYRLVERKHTVQDVIDATRIAKDSGLKVCYHMMLGLPGSDTNRDLESFKTLFTDQKFRPDMLKIYPCLVLRSAKIYDWWLEGKYSPYTTEEATELLVEIKEILPPWVRVMRIQRDIPAQLIIAGVKKGSLRQIVREEMRRRNIKCRCIRCREVGHRMLYEEISPNPNNVNIITQRYRASDGLEFFISAEDEFNDVLIGYLRLRFPSPQAHRPEVKPEKTSIIREIHVYGPLVPLGVNKINAWQHRGYGTTLLKEAEKISLENDRTTLLVTSAIGVREYFRNRGYVQEGPYMKKSLN